MRKVLPNPSSFVCHANTQLTLEMLHALWSTSTKDLLHVNPLSSLRFFLFSFFFLFFCGRGYPLI